MNLRIPRGQALLTLALALLATGIFVYLMGRFGGPELRAGDTYEAHATFRDSEAISAKSDVLVRGVKVGEVADKDIRGDVVKVTFRVYERYAPIKRDATVRIGEKSLLGEAYIDLDPGSRRAAELASGGEIAPENVLRSTELDEALEPLAGAGGAHMGSALRTFGRGARDPETPGRVRLAISELNRLVGEMRGLTQTLRGQSRNIAAGVQDTHTILAELGERDAQVQTLVAGGRATLEALAANRAALEEGLAELPRLLDAGRATLADVRPLVREARPLVADLRRAAPELTPALRSLRPAARHARSVIAALAPFNRTAVPFLDRADPVAAAARPAVRELGPALRNLVPVVDYLEPRRRTLVSWFTNTNAIRSDTPDSHGEWARFLLFMEDKTAFGIPCEPPACRDVFRNAYAREDDAPRLEPHARGSYPRLMPFTAR